jgi:hypothetical protein
MRGTQAHINPRLAVERRKSEGKNMFSRQLTGGSLAALLCAGALFASVATTQAAMSPVRSFATPNVRSVDCAVGAHIGPVGGCIIGTDDPPPVVVERRAADAPNPSDGCATKSVTRTDNMGNSETKTKTNC